MELVKTDMERELFLAAAEARKVVEAIEGIGAEEIKEGLRKSVCNCIQNALNKSMPVEDAILKLNEITGKEKQIPLFPITDSIVALIICRERG